MLFSKLKQMTNGELQLNRDVDVSEFSTDSRTMVGKPDEVFVAIEAKRDGHDYVTNALEKGVINFILNKKVSVPGANILVVQDTLKALQEIAQNHRSQFDIPIVSVTGSNGKTTVKEWLSTLLSQRFFVVKSPKSFNSQVGVPISLLDIRKEHEVGIFEAGISKVGEMENLKKMVQPTIGIFTNLGEAHDDGFDSKNEKLEEKLSLFSDAEKVICRNNSDCFDNAKEILGSRIKTWGDTKADYQVKWEDGRILVNEISFQTDFSSLTQLENLTHSIVTALELGLSRDEIQNGVDLIRDVSMRLELKRGINGCYILDDSYNNDEAGLKVALDYLESHKQNENRTVVLSEILHSAKKDEVLYRGIAELLERRNVTRFIGVGTRISAQSNAFPNSSSFYNSTEELLANLPDFNNEMIIIKGARDFKLERVVNRLQEKNHGTVLEVNFEALQHNLNQYRSLLKPEVKLMLMVKANAYGAGLLEVANFLQHQRVEMLGVAYVDEAIALRRNGIKIPIMIMNPYIDSFEQFERYDLQAEIFSITHFKRMLRDTIKHPKVHLKIDTGMHRLGFDPENLDELIDLLEENPDVLVEGIFTHFSSAEDSYQDEFTKDQAEKFEVAYSRLTQVLGYNPTKHACNSSGITRWPQYHFDMVRLGIGLHGFDPTGRLNLKYPSTLKTIISQIQSLKKGETVGYSRKGKIERDSRIAILPIGYEDGYSRIFGNENARVSIGGRLCPTIGNVCMDMIMVDVTKVEAKEGDEAILFGDKPSVEDLAKWSGTMPYEILTNVSSRVKRVFVSE